MDNHFEEDIDNGSIQNSMYIVLLYYVYYDTL